MSWPVAAAAGSGQQRPELFLGDPGGEDLAARIGIDAGVPHGGESLVGKAFTAGEESAPVGPFGVDLTATATAMVPADPLPHSGHSGVCKLDQVEVVDHELRVRQGIDDGTPVGRARVDRDELDPLTELLRLGAEPAGDVSAGAAQHLTEQPLGAVDVDESGSSELSVVEPFVTVGVA